MNIISNASREPQGFTLKRAGDGAPERVSIPVGEAWRADLRDYRATAEFTNLVGGGALRVGVFTGDGSDPSPWLPVAPDDLHAEFASAA